MNKAEEHFYKIAGDEITQRSFHKATYAKAVEEAMGNTDKIAALYIRYRVQGLKAEYEKEVSQRVEWVREAEEARRKTKRQTRNRLIISKIKRLIYRLETIFLFMISIFMYLLTPAILYYYWDRPVTPLVFTSTLLLFGGAVGISVVLIRRRGGRDKKQSTEIVK